MGCEKFNSKRYFLWKSTSYTQEFLSKKNSFLKTGFYNENFKISSDIEYIFRLFNEKKTLIGMYLNIFTLKMKLGGLSTNSFKNMLYANFESYIALKS